MDLSTGKNIHENQEWIIRILLFRLELFRFTRALEKVHVGRENLTIDLFIETLIEQAEQGRLFYNLIQCPLKYVPLTAKRITGIVSRAALIWLNEVFGASQRKFPIHQF